MGKAIKMFSLNGTIPHIDVEGELVSILLRSGLFCGQEWIWMGGIIFFMVEGAWKERFFKVISVGKDKFYLKRGYFLKIHVVTLRIKCHTKSARNSSSHGEMFRADFEGENEIE